MEFRSGGTHRMVRKSDDILWKKSFVRQASWTAVLSCWKTRSSPHTPHYDGASSTVKTSPEGSLYHASNIEGHFCRQWIKLFSTFQCPMFGAPLYSPKGLDCGMGGEVAFSRCFLFFKPVYCRCHLMVIGLQSAWVTSLIWVKDQPVSS